MSRLIPVLAMMLSLMLPEVHAGTCPVSIPDMVSPFNGTGAPGNTAMWFGDDNLAALIPAKGIWTGMGSARAYGDKFWWWRKDFDARSESQPSLTLHVTNIGDDRLNFTVADATSGFGDNWSAMLIGLEFPSAGCWEVVGVYGQHSLRMVLQVRDAATDE